MLHIFIDADACPVKQEVYRVASRCGLDVTLVANSRMRIPNEPWIALEVVANGLDAADDWIVEHVQPQDIVVTADIPLASRCLLLGLQKKRRALCFMMQKMMIFLLMVFLAPTQCLRGQRCVTRL